MDFWDLDAIKAFLSGVPDDKMIVIDVNSVGDPAWLKTDSFYGKYLLFGAQLWRDERYLWQHGNSIF